MNSMKTLPLILLTLSVCNAAPTAINPSDMTASNDWDTSLATPPASPTLGYDAMDASPTVTPFFTPAVFLPNYWTRPTPVADSSDFDANNAPAPEAEYVAAPEPTPPSSDFADVPAVSDSGSPLEPTMLDEQDTSATPTADATGVASSVDPDTSTYGGDAALVFSSSSASATFSVPTSQITLVPVSTHATPTSTPIALLPPTEKTKSESPATQMSRKAAVIGTILAVGSLVGLGACVLCTRCRISKRNRRSSTSDDSNKKDPEKTLLGKTLSNVSVNSVPTFPLPTLTVNAPTPSQSSTVGQDERQCISQQRPEWQIQMHTEVVNFEDVTHILSENAFAPLSGSERSSAATEISDVSIVHRESKGAVSVKSVKAESYATCESRYSHPSETSERAGSTQYLSMSPSSTPSPPDSPMVRTPKLPDACTITRTRSKTLTQPASPRAASTVSSSKSFPARFSGYSGRMSDIADRMEEVRESGISQGSEWDIAAAYGARYSKASSAGRQSKASSVGVCVSVPAVSDNVETVDFGGRNCVLVTGYAF
ncbi:hypothetical protein PHLGIDRAFT_125502 [Phlebiopsis gigantea 11061_1 CR5-6]|uniref:Uncharacterized protein n=1 Tax=Phlebiopsis gigantea (strain 11061_1 CR5-6) TaxID=745531 RepID=A0A0C3PSR9_PHLG1|nr:hypothetical protein PHLGIDRAFT_125502 [Phlebiopsis gigantea 11061_1 CR5-6]